MTQYNKVNVQLSASQLNKLRLATKNATNVTIRLSSNMIGDTETSIYHKLLLINRHVANLCKGFAKIN